MEKPVGIRSSCGCFSVRQNPLAFFPHLKNDQINELIKSALECHIKVYYQTRHNKLPKLAILFKTCFPWLRSESFQLVEKLWFQFQFQQCYQIVFSDGQSRAGVYCSANACIEQVIIIQSN